jgi:hypothetical protein
MLQFYKVVNKFISEFPFSMESPNKASGIVKAWFAILKKKISRTEILAKQILYAIKIWRLFAIYYLQFIELLKMYI